MFDSLPDGRRLPECIVVSFGIPEPKKVDYSGTERESIRVTILVKRLTDARAQADAVTAEEAMRKADLESDDGSYDLVGVSTNMPQPLPWNESGRYVWGFDTTITTQRKDFF